METRYRKRSAGVANRGFVAVGKNGVAIAPRLGINTRGCDADRKELEHTARERNRLARLGTMAAVFGHEVANPLNGIAAALSCVKSDLESPQFDIRHSIATLQGALLEIDRLGSLLNDFRSIACPQIIDLQKIDLEKNTKEVLFCQDAAYRKLGIIVEIQFENPLPRVMAHADKIKQVVLNLCKNAVESMPGGGRLVVKGYGCAPMVVLEIGDTGVGIPAGLDVFELFSTTKRDGSGLGLPLVRQIVAAHNGTINYTSVPGADPRTTFKISLPAAD